MAESESTRAWRPSGLVSLLTDFGLRDGYVGVMKAVLHGRCASLRAAIDLTHEVEPQDVPSASFHLAHAWRWFPAGSVHVAVVDPGVGTERAILVGLDGGQAFLAPDNGLLGPVLSPDAEVFELDVERFSLPRRSATFHGRDVFAPAAAALVGGLDPRECGRPAADWQRPNFPAPRVLEGGGWAGEVLCVDRFGNLVTNLGSELVRGRERGWRLAAAGRSGRICETYGEVAPGELIALVDSFGLLELSISGGDAARELGLARGARVRLVSE